MIRNQHWHYLLLSAVFSLGVHMFLVIVAREYALPFVSSRTHGGEKAPSRSVRIDTVTLDQEIKHMAVMDDEQDRRLLELLEKESLLSRNKTKAVLKGIKEGIIPEPKRLKNLFMNEVIRAPLAEIVTMAADMDSLDRVENRKRQPLDLNDATLSALIGSDRAGLVMSKKSIALDHILTLPPLSPEDFSPPEEEEASNEKIPTGPPYVDKQSSDSLPEIIDKDVNVQLDIYRDPNEDALFFRVSIVGKPEMDRFRDVPKDILFLIDASQSIGLDKLRQFKKGVIQSLDSLMKNADRFNIIAFRNRSYKLFPSFVTVDGEHLEKAKQFLHKLNIRGRTDLFSNLHPYIIGVEKTKRPYLIFLVSDGQTTTGKILSNAEIIRQIRAANQNGVSIFTFNTGEKANRFLMDFLAYNNRGKSSYVPEVHTSFESLKQLITVHSRIVLSDLSYQLKDVESADLYPKMLPHLYRGYPLVMYGKTSGKLAELVIRIEGKDREGKVKEFLLRRDLRQLKKGNKHIALQWAARRLYFLLNEKLVNDALNVQDEISALAERYHLLLPY